MGRAGFGKRGSRGGKKSLWEAGVNGLRMTFFLFSWGWNIATGDQMYQHGGSTLRSFFLEWSFLFYYFLPCILYLSLFSRVFFSRASLVVSPYAYDPRKTFSHVLFFSHHHIWLFCVTINMELSHTTIPARGRPWGKNRYPYQAFLCVLPVMIVLRDLKRVL